MIVSSVSTASRASAAALALSFTFAPAALARDAAAGREKAAQCAVCHGPQGLSITPDAPNLAGQPALYLGTQLRAYRSGVRRHEVMAVIAKPLSDDDIDNLSAWFSSQKIVLQTNP